MKRADAVEVLSEIRSDYNFFDKNEETEYRALSMAIEALKEQKTGKWMWVQYDLISELGDWYCSECQFMPSAFNLAKKHLNYCPNCGAYMRGEEE